MSVNTEPPDLEREYWEIVTQTGAAPALEVSTVRQINRLFTERIRTLAEASAQDVDRPLLVGCAGGLFAAETILTSYGVIILVGEHLPACLIQVASVIAAAMPYDTEAAGPPLLPEDEACSRVRELVGAALTGAGVPMLFARPDLPARRGQFADILAAQALDFVLAHELAHVLCGHLDHELTAITPPGGLSAGADIHSWDSELEADSLAERLVRRLAGPHPGAVELGATLVFELLESAYGWRAAKVDVGVADLQQLGGLASHPPAALRRSRITGPRARSGQDDLGISIGPDSDVDVVSGLMQRARGQTPPTPTPQARRALAALLPHLWSSDDQWLGLHIAPGPGSGGLTDVDHAGLWRAIGEDHDRARGAIVTLVFQILRAGPAAEDGPRGVLGLLITMYVAQHGDREDAGELWKLIGACIPDLEDLIAEQFHRGELLAGRRGEHTSLIMSQLGLFLAHKLDPPDVPAGRRWLTAAAQGGFVPAMRELGVVLSRLCDPPDLPAARVWLERAADEGDVTAMHDLGVLWATRQQPPDPVRARYWLEKAAATGDGDAMLNLGVLHAWMLDPPDPPAARDWFRRAAGAGHAAAADAYTARLDAVDAGTRERAAGGDVDAAYALGMVLRDSGDRQQARAGWGWLRRAADGGHPDALLEWGILLASAEPPDYEGARRDWGAAAAGGHVRAMRELAALLLLRASPPDPEAARVWWEKAAAAGDVDSAYNLGVVHAQHLDPPDPDAARYWYEEAAIAGHPEAAHQLSIWFRARDRPVAARAWSQRAAELGHGTAMLDLGGELARPADGTPPDLRTARQWFEKAAHTGDLTAMHDLGTFLVRQWQPPDVAMAIHWWTRAAEAGDADSAYNLGVLLADKLTPPDLDGSLRWLDRAATAGHVPAMHNLGVLLATRCDPPDRAAARTWWTRAAALGNHGSLHNLGGLLASSGDPADRAQARHYFEQAAAAGVEESARMLRGLDEGRDFTMVSEPADPDDGAFGWSFQE